jgi:anti-anti-sigma regulatory factor
MDNSLNECFLKISHLNGKCVYKLKGAFNENNIKTISKVILTNSTLNEKSIELDMSEVESINMQTMARLIIAIKELKEQGTYTTVTGLNGKKHKLAYELGMNYISQIN